MSDEESDLREQLAQLQRAYQEAAKPIIDRLVKIENCRCSRSLILTHDEFVELNIELPEALRLRKLAEISE